ncbi:MAG TPA: AAA family ATPase, partial [Allocoleopsis sp.]
MAIISSKHPPEPVQPDLPLPDLQADNSLHDPQSPNGAAKTVNESAGSASKATVAKAPPHQSKPTAADADLLKSTATPEESGKPEERLRPQRIADYVGQKALKEVLEIAIQAAKVRQESLDHLLLYGPPGLGKTTMSLVLATEMGVGCKITTAPALERPRDIVGLLVNLQPGDVLFIDEIHR